MAKGTFLSWSQTRNWTANGAGTLQTELAPVPSSASVVDCGGRLLHGRDLQPETSLRPFSL
jgi:hypothetical protein